MQEERNRNIYRSLNAISRTIDQVLDVFKHNSVLLKLHEELEVIRSNVDDVLIDDDRKEKEIKQLTESKVYGQPCSKRVADHADSLCEKLNKAKADCENYRNITLRQSAEIVSNAAEIAELKKECKIATDILNVYLEKYQKPGAVQDAVIERLNNTINVYSTTVKNLSERLLEAREKCDKCHNKPSYYTTAALLRQKLNAAGYVIQSRNKQIKYYQDIVAEMLTKTNPCVTVGYEAEIKRLTDLVALYLNDIKNLKHELADQKEKSDKKYSEIWDRCSRWEASWRDGNKDYSKLDNKYRAAQAQLDSINKLLKETIP